MGLLKYPSLSSGILATTALSLVGGLIRIKQQILEPQHFTHPASRFFWACRAPGPSQSWPGRAPELQDTGRPHDTGRTLLSGPKLGFWRCCPALFMFCSDPGWLPGPLVTGHKFTACPEMLDAMKHVEVE